MRKARKTTSEERLEIVRDCLANDKNYGAMAVKYNCSYQQVRNWVKRYEEMGSAGLEDRRGRRAGTQPARTYEEEMRDKIADLERRNRDLQMENDLLKKVRELEMKGRYLWLGTFINIRRSRSYLRKGTILCRGSVNTCTSRAEPTIAG